MLHVHRAARADALVAALADLLRGPRDPFEQVGVAVHSHGMERWLAQQLADRLGVCAGVSFPFPTHLVDDVMAAAGQAEGLAVWRPQRLAWQVLAVAREHGDEAWAAPLQPRDHRTAYARARHVADLLDRYAVHRPELLRAWQRGDDRDPRGNPLGHHAWQARTYREVCARTAGPSYVDRLDATLAALAAGPPPGVPSHVTVFGFTALPRAHLAILCRLAAHAARVDLFLLHPSAALWRQVAERGDLAGLGSIRLPAPRAADPAAALPTHPLLASWARDVRELQQLLEPLGSPEVHHLGDPPPGPGLLATLQADVVADRPPTTGLGRDGTISVHVAAGPRRQVEVLRDALVAAFAADPTLEPRHVVVMCPDVETFAPHVQAVFGDRHAGERGDRDLPNLSVRLADRALRQDNPVLRVLAQVLAMAGGRCAASEIVELLEQPCVRRRFRLDAEDVAEVVAWLRDGGFRWGLDEAHRERLDVGRIREHTLTAVLDRMALGVALDAEAGPRGGVTALDATEGNSRLVGRVAELAARLQRTLEGLEGTQPLGGWLATLRRAVDELTLTVGDDEQHRLQALVVLDEVERQAPAEVSLGLADVRDLLGDRLRGQPSRASHRMGDLTVCTLVPMRSVPHRIVALLGLDDEAFPRTPQPDSDDLVAADPRVGDRDVRSEDRQLLLDAVMSATDRLIVVCQGRDEATGEERPLAVPVDELLEVVATMTGTEPDQLVRTHPLHGTAPELFSKPAWGVDPTHLAAARAAQTPAAARTPFLSAPLKRLPRPLATFDDLVAVLKTPAKRFLRHGLATWIEDEGELPHDTVPVELGGLERWALGDLVLRAVAEGGSLEEAFAAEEGKGTLPPGSLQRLTRTTITEWVEQHLGLAGRLGHRRTAGELRPVAVEAADGALLPGMVGGLQDDTMWTLHFGKLHPRHRVDAWVRLLALAGCHPERRWRAVTIGRDAADRKRPPLASCLTAPPADKARAVLDDLARLADELVRAPLPLIETPSEAYATTARGGGDAAGLAAAADAWVGEEFGPDPACDEAVHLLVFGADTPFDVLAADGRFAALSRRLWDPLLDAERLGRR
ncbi:MAG: exodeoxyribonuclease V subunit gamma [Actinobacteria bacterium]|nr:exodeoxyribonuclease V subunit gamma [Actinomycetota bacterium]